MPNIWTPPTLPPSNRTNTTLQADNHPGDHNLISTALQAVIDQLLGAPGVMAYNAAQVNALTGMPVGMIIYQIDAGTGSRTSPGFYYWDSAAWQPLGSGGGAVGAELLANKNQPGGYAGLDVNGFVPTDLLPIVTQGGTRTVTASGATNTVDFAYGINFITLTANCTLSFINQAAGLRTTVILNQGGIGGFKVTWPSSATFGWDQNLQPYYTRAVNSKVFVDLMNIDGTITVGFSQAKDRSDQGLRTTAVETVPRREILNAGSNVVLNNGVIRLTYFTPDRLATVSNMATDIITLATGVTTTFAGMGLYIVNADNSLSALGRSTSDATLWISGATAGQFSRALDVANIDIWPGQYYAAACLYYASGSAGGTSTGMPTISSTRNGIADNSVFARSPRMCGLVNAQTNLPASIAAASIGDYNAMFYAELS